jgi:hypothetical protein
MIDFLLIYCPNQKILLHENLSFYFSLQRTGMFTSVNKKTKEYTKDAGSLTSPNNLNVPEKGNNKHAGPFLLFTSRSYSRIHKVHRHGMHTLPQYMRTRTNACILGPCSRAHTHTYFLHPKLEGILRILTK